MKKKIEIKLIEFAMWIYENSPRRWGKEDYDTYAKLQSKLKQIKESGE